MSPVRPDPAVDAYLAALPPERRDAMAELRRLVTQAAPDAAEVITYQMPGLRSPDGRFLVSYDAFKAHYSLFPASDEVVAACGPALTPYLAGKGTIRFPADAPLPAELITTIVKVRVRENAAAATARSSAKGGGPTMTTTPTTTTTTSIDPFLLEHTDDAWARPVPAALMTARDEVTAAARDLLAIPETALAKLWAWKGGSEEEIRYGAYRAAEAMEAAELGARELLAPTEGSERVAARLVGPTTAARWDLHGVLLPLEDALLDADPGDGEWTVRLTMGHVIAGQRGYGWGSSWWQGQGYKVDDPALPPQAPKHLWTDLPDEATTEAEGSVDELRARLDHVCDMTVERLAGLPDDRIDAGARWAGFAVTIGFRFGRWSSHIREHTIQVEKTFAMLGHQPTEPARLVRNLLAAYGRAEAIAYGRAGADEAAERILAAAREARAATASARAAAEAG